MKNWENRRSYILNSFTFLLMFLLIYMLTSVVVGFGLSRITPVDAIVWIIVCNLFMLVMVWTKFDEMSEGVNYVMKRLGAIEVNQFNQNPIVARYIKVVTEMTIAAGVPLPRLFILPSYDINAFAIATNDRDTAIAVTEGAISRLTRVELQALVGHEISHILHEDPKLNFKLIGWLFGLQSIYLYGYTMFSFFTRHFFGDFDVINRFCLGYSMRTVGSGTSEFSESNVLLMIFLMVALFPVILLSVVIMIFGAIGAVFARIIKSLISRQREYLADSESVRFVRGHHIVKVLEKIALLEGDEDEYNTTTLDAAHQEFSHFYLQNYQEKTSIFDTHPPILKRIRKILPSYTWPSKGTVEILDSRFVDKSEENDEVLVMALHDYSDSRRTNINHNILMKLGLDGKSQFMFTQLSKCYAAFIACNDDLAKTAQLDYLRAQLTPQLYRQVTKKESELSRLADGQKLQWLAAELPSFDNLAAFQIKDIEGHCKALVNMDNHISLSEYCMLLVVRTHIAKSSKNYSLEYIVPTESIATLEGPISELISLTTAIIFNTQLESARHCYEDIAAYLGISFPFQANLSWQKVLDESLPLMRDLSVRDQGRLEEVFMQLSDMPKLNTEGECLLYILRKSFNLQY